jgi:hypothetical protein
MNDSGAEDHEQQGGVGDARITTPATFSMTSSSSGRS